MENNDIPPIPQTAKEVGYMFLPVVGDIRIHQMYNSRRKLGGVSSSPASEASVYISKYVVYGIATWLLAQLF